MFKMLKCFLYFASLTCVAEIQSFRYGTGDIFFISVAIILLPFYYVLDCHFDTSLACIDILLQVYSYV